MLKSLMVFPDNNNNIFNVTNPSLNDNMAKFMQQSDLGASASSAQDYVLDSLSHAPSSSSSSSIKPSQQNLYPQSHSHSQNIHHHQQHQPQQHQPQQHQPQQHQQRPPHPHPSPQQPRRQSSFNQQQYSPSQQQQQQQQQQSPQLDPSSHQSNMHFSMVMSPMVVGNLSTPSSPSYTVIKTEENLQHNLDYPFVYSSFDVHSPSSQQQTHILPSQRSPHGLSSNQQRMMNYNHQGQQHQMRLQQQQRAIEQHQYQQYQNTHSQQQQQNIIYDPTPATPGRSSITSAMSMSMPLSVSIPVTSGSPSSLMVNSPTTTSAAFFTPAGTTPMPVFAASHNTSQSSLPKDDGSSGHHKLNTAQMMASLQNQHKRPNPSQSLPYSISAGAGAEPDSIHPVSPKRQRQDSGHQHLSLVQMSPSAIDSTISDFPGSIPSPTPQNTIATAGLSNTGSSASVGGVTMAISTGVAKRPRRSSTTSSRTSTGSGFELSSDYRATKAARISTSPSMPIHNSEVIDVFENPSTQLRTSARVNRNSVISAAHVLPQTQHHAFAAPQSHSQIQLAQPVEYTHVHTHTHMQAHAYPRPVGNVTHPRRAAQNRNAQRTFRNRRKAYIKDMEQKVLEINQTRSKFEMIHNENREIWGRYRALETIIVQNGLSMPSFPQMTPFFETDAGIAAANASASLASGTGASSNQQTQNSQGSESERDETDLLSHQGSHHHHNLVYKTEDSDAGEGKIEGGRMSPQQRQQQQQQRIDAHVHDLDIHRA